MYKKSILIIALIISVLLLAACSQQAVTQQQPDAPPQNPPEFEEGVSPGNAPENNQVITNHGNDAMMEENNKPDNTGQNSGSAGVSAASPGSYAYTIVDTGQDHCYSDTASISCPSEGESFYGQDAQHQGVLARYVDNGDGTVTDLNTGLMWQQTPDTNGDGTIDSSDKMTFGTALSNADVFTLAGYSDWRLPTIKELYSLMDFNGSISQQIPYIDTGYFGFAYGDTSAGERDIDAQFASSTLYVGEVMGGQQAMFGVNFADGRIKGYGIGANPGSSGGKTFYVLYVRDNTAYGINDFTDNGNGTVSDQATGLTWMQSDSGVELNWEEALNYCESLDYAGSSAWRLPNAKELQSIVDYTRSPQTTNSAAIDPIFDVTETESWYWTSTTHLDTGVRNAVYVAFGQAYGLPNGNLIDVHGAGAQRSDPKSGDPDSYSEGRGTQGQNDQVRVYNYARCVTGGTSGDVFTGFEMDQNVGFQPVGGSAERGQGGQPGQSGPPQEAIDACIGLTADSACMVNTPNGELAGSCMTVPSVELACVPESGPSNGSGEPPSGGNQQP